MLLLVVCVIIFLHFTYCMFVCLFSISVMLLTISFLISHYVYVSKHCVRKCMFVCLYVTELVLLVSVSVSLYVFI